MMDELSTPVPLDPLTEDSEDRRLWIGNLDPRISEFVLLKLLQKHGSIEKFDLLFHRSGPLEGQPRGYAFVTYSSADFAKTALQKLNGKAVGNKVLSVKWAHSIGKDAHLEKQKIVPNIPALAGAKTEKKLSKLTTIQAIEAKLKSMESSGTGLDFEINNKPSTSAPISVYSQQKQAKQYTKYRQKPYLKRKCK